MVKEDFKIILKGFAGDLVPKKVKAEKESSVKKTAVKFKESVQNTVILIKEIPHRINNGFKIFHDELMIELDKLPRTQKTKN